MFVFGFNLVRFVVAELSFRWPCCHLLQNESEMGDRMATKNLTLLNPKTNIPVDKGFERLHKLRYDLLIINIDIIGKLTVPCRL
jgi:hypothetical protein